MISTIWMRLPRTSALCDVMRRNRESAAQSRNRKKQYVEVELEAQVAVCRM